MAATAFKIQTGIPIPQGRNGGAPQYPFAKMSVGDCIDVPFPKPGSGRTPDALRTELSVESKKAGVKITARKIAKGRGKFYRVWRVK